MHEHLSRLSRIYPRFCRADAASLYDTRSLYFAATMRQDISMLPPARHYKVSKNHAYRQLPTNGQKHYYIIDEYY